MPTLAEASLNETELRAVEKLTALIEREFGNDLHGVWLYGSRARGEVTHDESDIDLMVVLDRPVEEPDRDRLSELKEEATGEKFWSFSTLLVDAAWISERRSIRAFFIEEVDRDKIVLAGRDGLPREAPREDAVTLRTEEFLALARERLEWGRRISRIDAPPVVSATAYEAIRLAMQAALSTRDRWSRTHRGTKALFSELFVHTGLFPEALSKPVDQIRDRRDAAHYGGDTADEAQAQADLQHAERFVAEIERLLR
jgi:predicted nucleotidyltransferase/uncharacterized protein (UPF0332 family)